MAMASIQSMTKHRYQEIPAEQDRRKLTFFHTVVRLLQIVLKRLYKTCESSNATTEKEGAFSLKWSSGTQFQRLKRGVQKCPYLGIPNYKLPFKMYADASALRFGAALTQQDARGKHRSVA